MALSIPPSVASTVVYRFAGVRVDTAARRLWVDDVERRTQPLVYNLLWLLCEQPHQVVTRDALFQRLWPDGSFPSDESLSQLVFKLRGLMSPYGGCVVTVRHVGIRLDADVRATLVETAPAPEVVPPPGDPIDPPATAANDGAAARADPLADAADPSRAASSPPPAPAQPVPVSLHRRVRWPGYAAVALLLAFAAALAGRSWLATEIDPGWGLTRADLGTWRPASITGIRDALAADTRGERARAVALMQAVHAGDPDTPVPALFLATWWGLAGDARAPAMVDAYRQRLGTQAPAYLHHLGSHLLGATPLGAPSAPAHLDLLLAARPRARRLLLARAHWHLGESELDAALADLRAIAIDDLADRVQSSVLLDRVSLGDGAAVVAGMRGLDVDSAEARTARDWIDAWTMLADGNAAAAARALSVTSAEAAAAGLTETERRVRLSAAVAAGRAGDYAQVREHLGAARALAIQQQRATQALQAGLLLLALPDWDPVTRAAMADELARMPAVAGGWECLEMRLTYVLTGLAGNPCPGVELPRTASLRGLAQLLDAGVAWQAGAADTARIHLAAAAAQGAERGLLGPWMWWMAARLGVPTQAGPPDLRLQPVLVTQAVLWWNPGAAGRLDPASQGRVPAGTAPR